ncbi:Protein roadkill [Araneus ventricosus]|uniref:Protein roadkill n=1 Tax=Araneus ventricosus TaxID=182803 RepID=A0A4Y2TIC3_ARAVE|nr:Protein roadkill [Araneus ventricosus]
MNFEQEQNWKFLLFATKWKLMAKKSLYLPSDILFLECEIVISTGISFGEIEETGDGISPELNPISDVDRFGDPSISSSALKDLGNLYRDQVLCDVTLKTDTEAFPAHTVILSARSSVFRAMFTSDMKEKKNACVNISDFESETVRQLLLYAYTDTVGDLKWDTAFQLYVDADKYAIISLKEKCSTFLKDSLRTSKVC